MVHHSLIIDRYYPADSSGALRDIYLAHCRAVADMALQISADKGLALFPEIIEHCAMLHDIGIFRCHAPSIQCFGSEPYIRHGLIGASLLRSEWGDPLAAAVAERHTGSGLTADEIAAQDLPLPLRNYLPETTLERLICYADKFFSKSCSAATPLPLDKVRSQMARFGEPSLRRFDALHAEFGA